MSQEKISNAGIKRSEKTVAMVREEVRRDGSIITITADLPVGRGWNDGSGVIYWINQGWRSADEYEAEKHQKEVSAKKEKAGAK